MNSHDAAYLAGLIDGEGSVFVQRVKTRGSKASRCGYHYRSGLSITMTDRKTIKWLVKTTGCGRVLSRRPYKKNHRPSFRWCIWSRQAASLLLILLPYLKLKKPHAENLIRFQNRMGWFGTPGNPKSEILRRERLRKIFLRLNKRGR